ncbi:hypothetical protein [Photorhabdus australis]|uniref:hypothetical protein n=1 Tax=Photorhabdus australis TaxID=286156 RepID=UPI0030DDB548
MYFLMVVSILLKMFDNQEVTLSEIIFHISLLSFKLLLCWLHSLTPVTELSMLPGIRSLAVAMHLEIYWVYI